MMLMFISSGQAVLEEYRQSLANDCYAVKLWTLVTATVSHLLLTLNSSTNFFVYCLMSTDFRLDPSRPQLMTYVMGF